MSVLFAIKGTRLVLQDAVTFLSDSNSHAPPSSGQYDYDDWTPGAVGFPSVGQSYTDPVFGGIIKRLTDTFDDDSIDDIYVRNGFWNSDGTRFMWASTAGGQQIISTVDGSEVRTSAPTSIGGEPQFAPDDADKMYWISGADLKAYSLASGTSSTVKTFPATLQALGGSVDYVSDDDWDSDYSVQNLLAYIRAGYAPTNINLKDSGHDSVTRGAVEGQFQTFNAAWARGSNSVLGMA